MAPKANDPPPPKAEFLRGPKDQGKWDCHCGRADNYGTRLKCRGCGRGMPQDLLCKAKARQAEHDKQAAARVARAEAANPPPQAKGGKEKEKETKAQVFFQAKLLKGQKEMVKQLAQQSRTVKPLVEASADAALVANMGGGG